MFDDNGSFLLAMLELFFFVAWFITLFWIFGDLYRSRDLGGVAKTLWTIFLIFLPVLGTLIYLIARGSQMTARAQAAQVAAQDRQDTSVTAEIASAKALLDSGAINDSEYERLKFTALSRTGTAPSEAATRPG